jgi:hypothetical protein
MFAALGTELMVLLLVVLAAGLAVERYLGAVRDRIRHVDVRRRRRAARDTAA